MMKRARIAAISSIFIGALGCRPPATPQLAGCQSGDRVACREAGDMAFDGRGVPRDHRAAASLYRQACDQEDMESCAKLARMVVDGDGGLQRDLRAAAALDRRACDRGIEEACRDLAGLPPSP